ncbi:IDEAL domain-containing protein [Calidifontibacillus oryziterrae]|uniref:IDEAL domain-containing protein n=1 Tax=Calidifontibacillus oryziterrae TaxID=1191699 RepID=UPI0003188127|nr:IDEAL domain-containing protein [Calidifontibacillus oryziterrae]
MKNRKSYTEHMKNKATELNNKEVSFVLDLYIQMVIDEALYNYKKNLLEKQINDALDSKDQEKFYEVAAKYNSLIRHVT